jgi:hypothetical protein
MLVVTVNKVVDEKTIIGKRAEEEEDRHSGRFFKHLFFSSTQNDNAFLLMTTALQCIIS